MMEIFSLKPKATRFNAIKMLIIYEIKKNINKRLVIALVILSLLVAVGTVALINYILSEPTIPSFVKSIYGKYKWYIIMSMPGFFIALIGIAIGGGLFSSEYEDKSSYVIYTKPVDRLDIFVGKVLGGYTVIVAITLFFGVLAIALSYIVFRDIEGIWAAPIILLATIYSQILYYSLTYMFSQLIKKTTIATIIGVAIIIIVPFIDSVLAGISHTKGLEYLKYIVYISPTWAAGLPSYIANDLLKDLQLTSSELSDPYLASIVILIYFILTSAITVYNLLKSDLVID